MSTLIRWLASFFSPSAEENVKGDDNDDKITFFGSETSYLWDIFHKFSEDGKKLQEDQLRESLVDLELYPSASQVREMVCCARGKSIINECDYLTFGEFCVLAADLLGQYRSEPTFPMPMSQNPDKVIVQEARVKRAGNLSHFQVFLGGSCNPTTWRRDEAIPFLKDNNVTFYNPQVSNWSPELIELEDQAKQVADMLFFVIDNQTRATASRVEVAYLVGCHRQIMVVLKDYEGPGVVVNGENITKREYNHLQQCQAVLTDLLERRSVPVFHSTQQALEGIVTCVRKGVKVQDLGSGHQGHPVKRLRNLFNSLDTSNQGKLNIHDVCLAYRCCMSDTIDIKWLTKLKGSDKATFTFEEFCCLITERRLHQHKSSIKSIFHTLVNSFKWFFGRSSNTNLEKETEFEPKDIFLGGSFKDSDWRGKIAIPLLRKHGLTYSSPQVSDEEWSAHLAPTEAAIRESCRLMLYVMGDNSRACPTLIEAGYYVGQGCNMVLCIQNLKDGIVINNEKLTPQSVKDYNRSRMYLIDIANREGVPVFDNLTEALQCAVQRTKEIHNQQQQHHHH